MTDGNIRKQHPQPCRLRVFCSSMYHSIVQTGSFRGKHGNKNPNKTKNLVHFKMQGIPPVNQS